MKLFLVISMGFCLATSLPTKLSSNDILNDLPSSPQYQTFVDNVFEHVNMERAEAFITSFVSFYNRHYTSQTGYDSAIFLQDQIRSNIEDSGYTGQIQLKTFNHAWLQPSVIARIEGSDPTLKHQIVVVGAHFDSLAGSASDPAPGADDNASGTTVVIEALNAFLYADFIPKRSIEFQFYAAEEVGLLGSKDIAKTYKEENIYVYAMMNLDVVGYYSEDVFGIRTTDIDEDLTSFLRTLIETYSKWGWRDRTNRGMSDHASFHENSYRSASPKEILDSPYWHTIHDTLDTVNLRQEQEFIKIAIAFVIELAEPYI